MKLLLGIIIGISLAIGFTVSAQQWGYTGQKWALPKSNVYKVRDGKVICYVAHSDVDSYRNVGISCLEEPK